MLADLRFRCAQVPGTRLRLERRLRHPRPPSPLLPIVVLGALGLAATLTTSSGGFAPAARAATVYGTDVVGNQVLVLVDNSGSMGGTDDAIQAQLTRLRAAGIDVSNRAAIPGFAVSATDPYSMMPALAQGLAANRAIDTVYILSDFSAGDDAANDAASIALVGRWARERRARIYWSSVRDVPAATYYALARESGGAVILMR